MYKVSQLQGYLPHFGKMEWIDEVEVFEKDKGTCIVYCDSKRLYCDGDNVRQSSCLEFIAQSYGFIIAANIKKETGKVVKIESAYLVGMKKVFFSPEIPKAGETLKITLSKDRQVGEITFVSGVVIGHETGITYCSATLKLYSK